jgi:hypothetical protein
MELGSSEELYTMEKPRAWKGSSEELYTMEKPRAWKGSSEGLYTMEKPRAWKGSSEELWSDKPRTCYFLLTSYTHKTSVHLENLFPCLC